MANDRNYLNAGLVNRSEWLDDWHVISPSAGTSRPEGTAAEWRAILAAMKIRMPRSFRRVAVEFAPYEHAWF